jgi:Ras-related protein Rab-23
MFDEVDDGTIRVLVMGSGGVGKSSLLRRFCKDDFQTLYKKTIGVDFMEKETTIKLKKQDYDFKFMVFDTPGQEDFNAITRGYIKSADAAILVFSTTDEGSLRETKRWKALVEGEVSGMPMVLVQNKIDLIDKATFNSNEADALAKELNLKLYRVSIKEDLNVHQGKLKFII